MSDHPDIRDLLLAADVLVTDDASLRFDVAVTGKPVLYDTYDLDHHRGDLRHFHLDLEQMVPGPPLGTADEVLDALGDIQAVTDPHRERYERFRERFCSRKHGQSTQRVLALVLREPTG